MYTNSKLILYKIMFSLDNVNSLLKRKSFDFKRLLPYVNKRDAFKHEKIPTLLVREKNELEIFLHSNSYIK